MDLNFTQLTEYGIFYLDPRTPGVEIFVKPTEIMSDILTRYEELVRYNEVAYPSLSSKGANSAHMKEHVKKDHVGFAFFFKLRVSEFCFTSDLTCNFFADEIYLLTLLCSCCSLEGSPLAKKTRRLTSWPPFRLVEWGPAPRGTSSSRPLSSPTFSACSTTPPLAGFSRSSWTPLCLWQHSRLRLSGASTIPLRRWTPIAISSGKNQQLLFVRLPFFFFQFSFLFSLLSTTALRWKGTSQPS